MVALKILQIIFFERLMAKIHVVRELLQQLKRKLLSWHFHTLVQYPYKLELS